MPSRRRFLAMGACASAGAVSSLALPGLGLLARGNREIGHEP